MQYIIKLGCWAVPLKKYQIKRKLPGSSLFYQTLFISYQTSYNINQKFLNTGNTETSRLGHRKTKSRNGY